MSLLFFFFLPMLRLDVTVVHQYFVGSVMNNRKKGIRLHHSLAGAKHFALLLH